MADDMIALDLMKRDALWCPWFPQFKLWPDAAVAALGDDQRCYPDLFSGTKARPPRC